MLHLQRKGAIVEQYFEIIKQCPLFADIDDRDLDSLLGCLSATRHEFQKGSFLFRAGDKAVVGIVLAGGVHIIQEDFWGNRAILAHVEPGGLFGESFSCAETDRLPVSVVATDKSEILMIDYRKIITTCPNSCAFHTNLIKNMMRILAQKNVMLTRKMEVLSMRTTREKLIAYLSAQAIMQKESAFDVPFSRQELADYLCVDRSALSRELGRMQEEGILRFDKRHFDLIQQG